MKRLMILALLVLAACGAGPEGFDSAGSAGVTMEFLPGYPAEEVYEGEPLPVSLTIRNEGTADVPVDKLYLSFAYDPLYLSYAGSSSGVALARFVDGPLHGRSPYYPQGDEAYAEEYDIVANEIAGNRQSPETQLTALLCYEYRTKLSEEVCIDVDRYLRTGREQACEGRDLAPGTQGAPVAFKSVEVRTSPVDTGGSFRYARPEFIISLRNVGGGTVVAPPQDDFASSCRLEGLADEELNAVVVNGTVFNLPLECSPSIVRLRDGEGRTRCTVRDEDVGSPSLAVQQNILTVLQLNAHYLYRDSLSSPVTIKGVPDTGATAPAAYEPRRVRYVYEGGELVRDSEGNPVTQCSYDVARGELGENFSCACGKRECRDIDQEGYCVYGKCPGNLYCCDQGGFERSKNSASESGSS